MKNIKKNKLNWKNKSSKSNVRFGKISSVKTTKAAKIVKTVRKPAISMKNKNSFTVEEMIHLVTEAIQFKFKGDKSEPGLTISKLKNGDMYVSIVRFNGYFGKDKSVAFKARGTTLLGALCDVAQQITKVEAEENPLEQLSKYLHSSPKDVSDILIYDAD